MNRRDLYNSFHEIDEDILERSENARKNKKRVSWPKWIALAAAVVLICFLPAAFREAPVTPSTDMEMIAEGPPSSAETDSPLDERPEESASAPYGNTSDTYAALPELLAYLSSHDSHLEEKTDASTDASTDATGSSFSPSRGGASQPELLNLTENTGVAVNAAGDYAYHIGESTVSISRLDEKDTENAGSIHTPADGIFLCNSNLLVISRCQSGDDELNPEMSVRVSIYDITSPRNPVLLDEYIQLGDLTACWMSGANLYLVTSDGVCACGWSRLEDASQYYPALSHNGESMEWGDDYISILGEPTRVQYSAITVINGNSRDVVDRKALYGNIQNLFYGADWLAAAVSGETEVYRENPVVYTFDSGLTFTGKISPAQIIDAPESNPLQDDLPQDGGYLRLLSVTKKDGLYRMLGTYSVKEGNRESSYFLAATADPGTGRSGSQLLSAEGYPQGEFTEILWEENRAVSCIGVMENGTSSDLQQKTRFLFTEFDGLDISFHENDLEAAYLNYRVGVGYGNPFGKFRTLIPLGNGLYVRYSHPGKGPGGFDLFDFSDSSAPLCLYRPETSLSGDDAFDYAWHVYDEHTFGTLKVLLGDEDSFRDVKLSWCVYTVDSAAENAVSLQKEIPLDGEVRTYFGADSLGFAVFHAGDDLYYVTKKQPCAVLLK